ncbi:MAG TPA: SAM-dependent chlorinase/fluorinase [Tepidiformaceae bacterium]
MTRPIFLLTDFGTRDHHVGQVRAVISGIASGAPILDLTHHADPFAVDHGAWLLETALPALPAGAVVFAVVDPGVGTARRGLAVSSGGRLFVGPDNGILSPALRQSWTAVELQAAEFRRDPVSPTFHARDIFGPAAAHLASGVELDRLGPSVSDPVLLPPFCAREEESGRLEGYIIHVDHFGNAISTVRSSQLPASYTIQAGECRIEAFARTFGEASPGVPACYIDSSGFLGITINQGDAARTLGLTRGTPVTVVPA